MLGLDNKGTGESGQLGSGKVVSESQAAVAALLDALEARQAEIGCAMATAIIREDDPVRIASSHDPEFRARFETFCTQHVRAFIRTCRQGRVAGKGDLGFVREVAQRRADDAFPLPALMEGLRVGHRVLNQRIRQLGSGWNTPAATVLSLTTRLIEYMDAVGTELAESYRTRQSLSAGRGELIRREMLDDLLEGRYASRPDAALLAGSVGFEPDAQYSVAVFFAIEGTPQALAAKLSQAVFALTSFRFVVPRGDEVVGVFRAADTDAITRRICNQSVRIGISTKCRGIGEVPRGYWEAIRAIRFASEGEPCVDLSRLGPLRYLEFSADSVARQLAVQYLGSLRHGPIADTLLAYVAAGFNAKQTAERLGVHLNTVHNRLERAAELLGKQHLGPLECLEAATALRIGSRELP
jgi:PucR C-terminal helix-turn-helix domain/GGDEF-like domain